MCKMLVKGKAEHDPRPKETAMLEFHSLDIFDNIARPRILNSHNGVQFIPDGYKKGTGRIIFVQRNPKDVAVSFFNHLMNMREEWLPDGKWDDYFYAFIHYGGTCMIVEVFYSVCNMQESYQYNSEALVQFGWVVGLTWFEN